MERIPKHKLLVEGLGHVPGNVGKFLNESTQKNSTASLDHKKYHAFATAPKPTSDIPLNPGWFRIPYRSV